MPNRLVFRPHAAIDLARIYDFIAEGSPSGALDFIGEIERLCNSLRDFPEQGRARDDLLTGLRILPYQRRAVIAYRVAGGVVEIVRIFYGGQDYETLLGGEPG